MIVRMVRCARVLFVWPDADQTKDVQTKWLASINNAQIHAPHRPLVAQMHFVMLSTIKNFVHAQNHLLETQIMDVTTNRKSAVISETAHQVIHVWTVCVRPIAKVIKTVCQMNDACVELAVLFATAILLVDKEKFVKNVFAFWDAVRTAHAHQKRLA
jgi:hypothetical protein